MYIYRSSADEFGSLVLIPQDFFKFWNGDVDVSDIGTYVKPLEALPEITWEIYLTADDWRFRIANADPTSPIPMATLREIPDTYIEAVFLNAIYGYNMSYLSSRTTYLPLRMGYTFTQNPIAYPGYAMLMLGLKTLIQDELAKNNAVGASNAEVLRLLLRHITYVAVVIAKANVPLEPNGKVLVGALTSTVGVGCDVLFYDTAAMSAFELSGGNADLVAANWVINKTDVDSDTLDAKEAIMSRWMSLTDITAE